MIRISREKLTKIIDYTLVEPTATKGDVANCVKKRKIMSFGAPASIPLTELQV